MAALTDTAELDLLEAILQNTAWGTLLAAGAAANLYLALCTGDPGESGDMANNEITAAEYGEYARQTLVRATAWDTDGGNGLDNAAEISFPQMSTGTGCTASHFAICLSDTELTDDAIIYGALSSGLAISAGITPSFAAGALDVTAN